jgi:Protein of unknown function (DUF3800)
LYLDESGTHAEARHFVVAGLSLFERQTYHLAEEVNKLQARYFPTESEPVELHAAALRGPDEHAKPPYNSIPRAARLELLDSVYDVLVRAGARLFAVVMGKNTLMATRMSADLKTSSADSTSCCPESTASETSAIEG